MISKITNIQGNGTYNNPTHGTFYTFEYTFEDGTTLSANHKTEQSPFKVGDEVEYTVRGSNAHGDYGKVDRVNKGSGYSQKQYKTDENREGINRCVALNNAVQLHQGDTTEAEVVLATAENFYAWLNK